MDNPKYSTPITQTQDPHWIGPRPVVSNPEALTPIEQRGSYWFKRDDLFDVGGARGGKARSCLALAREGTALNDIGLVTASSRHSPQALIVARVARAMDRRARLHMPAGPETPVTAALRKMLDVEIIMHRPGHNSVIIARAQADAMQNIGWQYIPFGMECWTAVNSTMLQASSLTRELLWPHGPVERIVIPVGSAISVSGVLAHLVGQKAEPPLVVGVKVGADPTKRLDKWAPPFWRHYLKLVDSGMDYGKPAPVTEFQGIGLDLYYEAKCIPFLKPNDLLWIVGHRGVL